MTSNPVSTNKKASLSSAKKTALGTVVEYRGQKNNPSLDVALYRDDHDPNKTCKIKLDVDKLSRKLGASRVSEPLPEQLLGPLLFLIPAMLDTS